MAEPLHQRKREEFYNASNNSSGIVDKKMPYVVSAWTGTLRLFTLYPLLFLFYVVPVIFKLNGLDFLKVLTLVAIYLIAGSLLAKLIILFSPNFIALEKIKAQIMICELTIVSSFLFYSFSVYIFPLSSLQSALWFVLGFASTYHDFLEKNFVTRMLGYKVRRVETLLESPEIMIQSFTYFLLLLFLTVFFPFLMSAMLSFFPYIKDNFNTFLPITFGNLVLIFTLIYHTFMMRLDTLFVEKKTEKREVVYITRKGLFKLNEKELLAEVKNVKSTFTNPYKLFRISSVAPLFGLNFFFIKVQTNTSHVTILLNLAILYSVSLILKTALFFYLPAHLKQLNLVRLSQIAMGAFVILLVLYIKSPAQAGFGFDTIASIFLGIKFITDFIWICSIYEQKESNGKLKIDSYMLSHIFSILTTPALIIIAFSSVLVPFILNQGVYVISILVTLYCLFRLSYQKEK